MGSNLGNREANLRAALELLRRNLAVTSVSSIYETEPVGVTDQPRFLNLSLRAATDLAPHDVLRLVKSIERDVGRRPTFRWGPRVVDIDILLYGDQALTDDELTVPHRELANRAFVLVPLAEIAPDARHPTSGKTVSTLLEQRNDAHTVRLFSRAAD